MAAPSRPRTAAERAAALGLSRATYFRRLKAGEIDALAGAAASDQTAVLVGAVLRLADVVEALTRQMATLSGGTAETTRSETIKSHGCETQESQARLETAHGDHQAEAGSSLPEVRTTWRSSDSQEEDPIQDQDNPTKPPMRRFETRHNETAAPPLPGLSGPTRVATRPKATSVAQRLREVTTLVYADRGFRIWWAAYPNKTHKPEAAEAWYLAGAVDCVETASAILAGLEHWCQTWEWTKDHGAYVPRPDRFITQARYEARPDPRKGLPVGSTWMPPAERGLVEQLVTGATARGAQTLASGPESLTSDTGVMPEDDGSADLEALREMERLILKGSR